MDTEKLIERFESELSKVNRDDVDKVLNYIRNQSDFYTAPSSTKFHLSCPGGLLQHSINVLDALRALLPDNGDGTYSYMVAGKEVATIKEESVIIVALLHDICKTRFYAVEMRNKKINGAWVEVPTYTVEDEIPYGHGEKSVFMIESMMKLSMEERMYIRWHMGFPDDYNGKTTFGMAVDKYPIIWAVHTADMQAAHMMEGLECNREMFQ